MTGRQGRRCLQLLGGLKEKRGYRKLQEEALYRTVWRTGFGGAVDLSLAVIWVWFVFLSETNDRQTAQNCYNMDKI